MDREFLAEYERQGGPEVFLGMTIRDGVLTNWQLDNDYDAFLRTCILPEIDPENCVFFPSIVHRIEMQSVDIKTQEYRTFILTDAIQDINPNAFPAKTSRFSMPRTLKNRVWTAMTLAHRRIFSSCGIFAKNSMKALPPFSARYIRSRAFFLRWQRKGSAALPPPKGRRLPEKKRNRNARKRL